MGAGLCGSKAVTGPEASEATTEHDQSASSIRKVEDWLHGSRLLQDATPNSAEMHVNDKRVDHGGFKDQAKRSVETDMKDSDHKLSDVRNGGLSSVLTPSSPRVTLLWKNVRNVVNAAHGFQDVPSTTSPSKIAADLEEISEEQAKVLRAEFESVSAPKATIDFQKLQKLQARIIRRRKSAIGGELHANPILKLTRQDCSAGLTEREIREHARRTAAHILESAGKWNSSTDSPNEGACLTFEQYLAAAHHAKLAKKLKPKKTTGLIASTIEAATQRKRILRSQSSTMMTDKQESDQIFKGVTFGDGRRGGFVGAEQLGDDVEGVSEASGRMGRIREQDYGDLGHLFRCRLDNTDESADVHLTPASPARGPSPAAEGLRARQLDAPPLTANVPQTSSPSPIPALPTPAPPSRRSSSFSRICPGKLPQPLLVAESLETTNSLSIGARRPASAGLILKTKESEGVAGSEGMETVEPENSEVHSTKSDIPALFLRAASAPSGLSFSSQVEPMMGSGASTETPASELSCTPVFGKRSNTLAQEQSFGLTEEERSWKKQCMLLIRSRIEQAKQGIDQRRPAAGSSVNGQSRRNTSSLLSFAQLAPSFASAPN